MPEPVHNMPSQVTQHGAELWDKILALEMPTRQDYVNMVADMHLAVAILLLMCGMVYLLHGWKAFKMLVIINAAILGGFVGHQVGRYLPGGENLPLFGGLAGGVLFAVLSWPLMKFAISIMGALAGAFLGYGIWNYLAVSAGRSNFGEYSWAGALIGLVALGLLALVIFRWVVMVFTSLQGSLLTVSAILSVLMRFEPLNEKIRTGLTGNFHLLMLLLSVPAMIGFGFQYTAMAKKARKKKKATEGGDM